MRVLLVDLNNHARYPTLAVGLLVAILRGEGHAVRLLSPLAAGVRGLPRDQRARSWGYWDERLRWWTARTSVPGVQGLRRRLSSLRGVASPFAVSRAAEQFTAALRTRPDVVLLSAYHEYQAIARRLLRQCARAGLPALVGGPGFTSEGAATEWLALDGVHGLFRGECEPFLAELVERAARGDDLAAVPGCSVPGRAPAAPAPPLEDLDALPFPDYDDFPWERYPTPVIATLTGRGCGWGACTFCSDVLTSNGRTFRSRSVEDVLAELTHHHARRGVSLFHFGDLKLNSNVGLWRALAARFQRAVPGARWTCSVHVGRAGDQGLTYADLRAARAAGCVRITTGVESGSQGLLDAMAKGTLIERTERFLRDARRAGLSVRVSMFTGYPGETARDLDASAALLERHAGDVDRVHLSRFLILPGTPIAGSIEADPERFPELRASFGPGRVSSVPHADRRVDRVGYQRSLAGLLRVVHRVNRRTLPEAARVLEGAM